LNTIGDNFFDLEKYDNALEAYERAIQLTPDRGLYWSDKGNALKALGRTTEADAAYARADELGYIGSTWTPGNTTISPTQGSTLTVCPSGCDYTSIQMAVYAAHPMIQLRYIAGLTMRA